MQIDKLTWEETVRDREIEDWMEETRNHRHTAEQRFKAVGLLTWCVNSLEGITDGERGLLREMLTHAQTNTMAMWGAMNIKRMTEVETLFEKIKGLIK